MPRSTRRTKLTLKQKIDTMSITVLLLMTLFGGIVGYLIGQSTGINQALLMQNQTQR